MASPRVGTKKRRRSSSPRQQRRRSAPLGRLPDDVARRSSPSLGLDMMQLIASRIGPRNRASLAATSRLGRDAAKFARRDALERTRKQMRRNLARVKSQIETAAWLAVERLVFYAHGGHDNRNRRSNTFFVRMKNAQIEFELYDKHWLNVNVTGPNRAYKYYGFGLDIINANTTSIAFEDGRNASAENPIVRFIAPLARAAVMKALAQRGITQIYEIE